MKISIPRIKKNEQLFFISYSFFMFFSVLMHSLFYQYYLPFYRYIVGVCVLLLILQEIKNNSLTNRALFGAIILGFTFFLLIIQGTGNVQTSFACIFLFAFGARNIEFKKICRITMYITLILILFVIFSSLVGLVPNYCVNQVNYFGELRLRYFLGFRYALNAPALLLNSILLYVYVKHEDSKYIEIVLLGAFATILYLLTDSRLTFALSIMGLLIAVICKIRKNIFEGVNKLIGMLIPSFLICFAISIWFAIAYSPNVSWMKELNKILGNRLRQGQYSFIMYGVSLFGLGNIEWVGAGLNAYGQPSNESYFYVDNFYIQVLQRYGIIFIIIFLVLTTILMIQCYKKEEHLLVVLLTIIALHGLIDDGIMYLQMNTFWLLLGPAVFGYIRDRKEIKQKKTHGRIKLRRLRL